MESKYNTFIRKVHQFNGTYCRDLPSVEQSRLFTEGLIAALFPMKRNCVGDEQSTAMELERCGVKLREILYAIKNAMKSSPDEICQAFFEELPAVFDQLVADAEAIGRYDPAASCVEEVILSYPGFFSITVYRLAHILYQLKVPFLPRIMSEYAHERTGIDIHPGARIASPFYMDHGTGIVIGESTVIGKEVRIFQGVTLGALTVEKSMAKSKRHPTIEDHVVIYAGSTILGGQTVIGHHSVVGGNTWITESILPYSVVYRNHRVQVKDRKDFETPIDFVI